MRHIRIISRRFFLFLLGACLGSALLAAEQAGTEKNEPIQKYKSGYSGDSGFGGPTSVTEQLREDDEVKAPALRFQMMDDALDPWFGWKKQLNEEYGLELGVDYSALYQDASDSLTGEDQAASGVFRLFGRWTLFGRGTQHPGALVFKVENRHRLGTDIPPAQLGFDVGYNGITGTLYSDVDWVLGDLNWQQAFNGGRAGFLVGRFDPSDYIDVSGYANPWTTFSNAAILVNTSIALPDFSTGIAGGTWLGDQWAVLLGANDANGVIDSTSSFADGAEFFSYAEVLWSPSRADRYTKNAHVTLWHVDKRDEAGVPESKGIAIAANWTFNKTWMPFFRAGWSDDNAPLMNKTITGGFMMRFFGTHRDLLGLGFNWGDPSNDDLRDQYTGELFYRYQLAENLAITPSAQLLVDPALNPDEDKIWVLSLRARLTL